MLARTVLYTAAVATAAAGLLCSTPPQSTQAAPNVPRSVETSGVEMITPATQRQIEKGLEWLAARQHDEGSFGSGQLYPRNVAVTSLCAMAFMSAGSIPGRGRYGENVERALDYILSKSQPSGYILAEDSQSHGPMYGHGFATLFLAEVYGMTERDDVRDALVRAVRLIVNSQNKDGGWRYTPESQDADVSVTVCQIMALRAARNSGIAVPKETVERCVEYVQRSQNNDGGFSYRLAPRSESIFPRSAAGVVALYSAGVYEGREIERGLDYLIRYLPRGNVFPYESHYYYGHYYGIQAMWHAGGDYWERWYPAIRDELLRRQSHNGSWNGRAQFTVEYNTAMALIVLQLPNQYLPIFQR